MQAPSGQQSQETWILVYLLKAAKGLKVWGGSKMSFRSPKRLPNQPPLSPLSPRGSLLPGADHVRMRLQLARHWSWSHLQHRVIDTLPENQTKWTLPFT